MGAVLCARVARSGWFTRTWCPSGDENCFPRRPPPPAINAKSLFQNLEYRQMQMNFAVMATLVILNQIINFKNLQEFRLFSLESRNLIGHCPERTRV